MEVNPKISVLIPTRERCDVLSRSLATVVSQNYDNLKIIVSDNYSNDNTKDVVLGFRDDRITYINPGKRISMSDNWEFALSHVQDGWITILGDDDGLLPNALAKVAEIIRTTGRQAIRSSVCSYLWPRVAGREYGRLSVPLTSGFEIRNSRAYLSKLMHGRCEYSDLPMLYNGGFLKMFVVNEIKKKTGIFYQSCNPDIYSAVAVSSVIDDYVFSYDPLAINGASSNSTGTSHFSSENSSNPGWPLSPAQKFLSEGNKPLHQDIPLCSDGQVPKSLQALVYESYLQSSILRERRQDINHEQQLKLIVARSGKHDIAVRDWARLFASCHQLDFIRIENYAMRRRKLAAIRAIIRRISTAINTYSVGSQDAPIRDVYDASIVAAVIRNIRLGRLRNFRRLIGRRDKMLETGETIINALFWRG
jgi:hypothetical protein